MRPVQMLALGRFKPDDLIVTVNDSNRAIDPVTEKQIDSLWEAKAREAITEGRVCYNGISYRLNSLKVPQDGTILIDFGPLEYKAREALPAIPGYFSLSDEYYRKGCYSGATVKTLDGRYLIVELSGKSMNRNKLDVLGGIFENSNEIRNGTDVFNALYAELEEEGCVHKTDLQDSYLRAIYMEPRTNIGFYFEIDLSVSSEEILERFAHEKNDQDIAALHALTREEYMAMLRAGTPGKQLIANIITI